jgi:hypothetical protein
VGVVVEVHDVLAVRRQPVRARPERARLVALLDEAVPVRVQHDGQKISLYIAAQ